MNIKNINKYLKLAYTNTVPPYVHLTLLCNNALDPVEEASVSRICRTLVIDELHLDRLHRRDGKDGLCDTSAQATQ